MGLTEMIGRWYCTRFHSGITRPVNDTYRCTKCLREFTAGPMVVDGTIPPPRMTAPLPVQHQGLKLEGE